MALCKKCQGQCFWVDSPDGRRLVCSQCGYVLIQSIPKEDDLITRIEELEERVSELEEHISPV